jgi:hypothetical protein
VPIFKDTYNYEKKVKQKKINEQKSEFENLNNIIQSTFDECDRITILPLKYRSLVAVSSIIDYFNNQRADSLKEAINLYEDECNRKKQNNLLNHISTQQNNIIKSQQTISNQIAFQSILIAMKK